MTIGSQITPKARRRKLDKLHGIRVGLSTEARNPKLSPMDRMHLARAVDALRAALEAMEAVR